MAQILVLNVSCDRTLLETRSQVLRQGGYTVTAALSLPEAAQKFRTGDFDLVTLCHSISTRDRQHLADWVHKQSPFTPVVLVGATDIDHDDSVDATIGNDPEQLLAGLLRVLHHFQQRISKASKSA